MIEAQPGGNKREKKHRRRILDGRTTRLIRAFLIDRDGPNCYTCNSPANPVQGPLQVNHNDGNPENNEPRNLNLMHPACNRQHFLSQLKIRERKNTVEPLPFSLEMSYESRKKLQNADTLSALLNQMLLRGPVTVKQAEDTLGELTETDQQVIRRWIDRKCSAAGPYTLSDRLVRDRRKVRTEQYINWKPGKMLEEAERTSVE